MPLCGTARDMFVGLQLASASGTFFCRLWPRFLGTLCVSDPGVSSLLTFTAAWIRMSFSRNLTKQVQDLRWCPQVSCQLKQENVQ